ncbi:MAG: ribonucleoside-diphosphate reductase, adenosylcobalamin-dependent [Methanobacterium sp. BRmetb2]|nr:MAG: ribonucleoside-diphosphate reductase, adenosylcobalamin-dependent [Methanobacterium sp. BRmetb2]
MRKVENFAKSYEVKLSVNAIKILKKRYLLKDESGKLIETPSGMFRRVTKAISVVDEIYEPDIDLKSIEEKFYDLMSNLEFLPNSPTLMNAGTQINQLSACFVLPVEDSMGAIFDSLKYMALIHKSGGGVGFSFSQLRPRGDVVKSTKGIASGPVSFMRIFDVATDVIKQGGRRRGANMAVMDVNHPDILDFISSKVQEGLFKNFNLSVAVPDSFMDAVLSDGNYELINPRNRQVVRKLKARYLFDKIVEMAWKTGDPGLIFIDEINRHNTVPKLGKITATNPCGEQPLMDYESCNLGSINLTKIFKNGKINWKRLEYIVNVAVHFLDNVIDVNNYPSPKIENETLKNRKIGLGVMGFADLLLMLGIPYDSVPALKIAEEIMKFISKKATEASIKLGKERGSFSNFKDSKWYDNGFETMRNATTTTIAPTGTISILAGVTSGIEPLFAVSFVRKVLDGTKLMEINPVFKKIAEKEGFFNESILKKIAVNGSIQNIEEIPETIRRLFVTAYDIPPQCHVKMQASFQKYVDNAVSKTVNLPTDASQDDIKNIFILAYKLKCKGITIYRYGTKKEQVIYLNNFPETDSNKEYLNVDPEFSGGCPKFNCPH